MSSFYSPFRIAKDFIVALLNPDPAKRLTTEEALSHPVGYLCTRFSFPFNVFSKWLTTQASCEHDLSGLRDHFNPRARWKAAIAGARALHRFGSSQSRLSSKSSGGWKTLSDSDDDDDDDDEANGRQKEMPGENDNVKVTSPDGKILTASPEQRSEPPLPKLSESHDAQPAKSEVPSTEHQLDREDEQRAPLEQKVPVELDEHQPKPSEHAHQEPSNNQHLSDTESEEFNMPGSFRFRPERASNGHHHTWTDLMKKLRIK